jgi:MarR family
VKAHALLHQATRARDGEGRIVANLVDYAVVRQLVEPLVAAGAKVTVPKTLRETVAAVIALGPGEVTVAQVARHLQLDHGTAWRRIDAAVREGYVVNREDRRRRPARLTVGDPMPSDAPLLPRARELRASMRGSTVNPPRDTPDPQTADAGVCTSAESHEGMEDPSPPSGAGNGVDFEEGSI